MSLRDIAREQIRLAILEGVLKPGESLQEDRLVDWLDMSRTPIREALVELARTGLVEVVRRHVQVVQPRTQEVEASLQSLGAMMGPIAYFGLLTLDDLDEQRIMSAIAYSVDQAERRDVEAIGFESAEKCAHWFRRCPNRVLVRAVGPAAEAMSFRLRAPELADVLDCDRFLEGLDALRTAVERRDASAGRRAMERIHRFDAA